MVWFIVENIAVPMPFDLA
uniref:Uncharacterized protein n=1 Tax=Rhizophora mucronata TaxID=61149 RepID=A0A2P2PGS5_RHIMU